MRMEATLDGARHNMDLVDGASRFASYTHTREQGQSYRFDSEDITGVGVTRQGLL